MRDDLEILLTNDDGIDSPGLRALADALAAVADVTVVAPADDQSAVGRSLSHEVDVLEHDLGYAVAGTPADCVVAGLGALAPDPDLVVSGCNRGANLGEYVLGRSGTISAAVEAAFFDVPAIATSMYVPAGDLAYTEVEVTLENYAHAVDATTYLCTHALDAGVFEATDYLNLNAPIAPSADATCPPLELTRPSKRYEMDAAREGERIHLRDRVWERMEPETLPDPAGTDRRAVVEGRISLSALTAPHTTSHHDALERLVGEFPEPTLDA
ncbi:5'/3'-nucleotidase SurE [Natronobiforma cellulositropha]|uniref:5'/3'-nucleotidase SurE n=1 Tax=Natronobiforma cellulositropha TaxID=1679076 RepID=UPI0021D56A68|nr:5'/3'-nucleotidase SurE [Natronobiforma cellulositropha]